MMHGTRELLYFLSRRPKSNTLGCWMYNPLKDQWEHPNHSAIPIRLEAQESIRVCLYAGLSRDEIDKFLLKNIEQVM